MRISMTQLLMTVTFAVLAISWWLSENPDYRRSWIDSIVFSPDGAQFAVVGIEAHEKPRSGPFYPGTMKGYPFEFEHPKRSICLFDSQSGQIKDVLLRESNRHDCSELFADQFFFRSSSARFNPKTSRLITSSLAKPETLYFDTGSKLEKFDVGHTVSAFNFSKTGNLLACFGDELLTVFETESFEKVLEVRTSGSIFSGAGVMVIPEHHPNSVVLEFSKDEKTIFAKHDLFARSWEISDSMTPPTIYDSGRFSVHSIAIPPDGSLLFCTNHGVVEHQPAGVLVEKLSGLKSPRQFSFSRDHERLAIVDEGVVKVFELQDNFKPVEVPKLQGKNAMISPNGKLVAVGDRFGKIALHDIESGALLWEANLPKSRFLSVHHASLGIALWFIVAFGLFARSRMRTTKSETRKHDRDEPQEA